MAASEESANSASRMSGTYTSMAPAMNSGVPAGKPPRTMLAATHAGTTRRSTSTTSEFFRRSMHRAITTADATMPPAYSLWATCPPVSNE